MRLLRVLQTVVAPSLYLVASLSLVPACGGEPAEAIAPRAQRATAPSTSKADGSDEADRSCRVVLRTIRRPQLEPDHRFETECVDGICTFVWAGQVEVDAKLSVARVGLLYRLHGDTTWWQVDGTLAGPPALGYARYDVRISEHLFGPSASAAELSAARIDLIPFFERADGTRVFDHNRVAGAFENYRLDEAGYFLLNGDERVCRPVLGRISFAGDWSEHLSGQLHQGGYLVIDYDLERLPKCRATHNGYPAWGTLAYVRFSPGGELVSGSVRTFETVQGVPINSAVRRELEVQIPAGATSAAIWFKNESGAGNFCETWDSNLGANYTFAIAPAADDARCKDVERWSAVNSDVPYRTSPTCLDYQVTRNHGSSHCELYLSGIGHGYTGHYGIPNRWVEAYLRVGPIQGELLGVGIWARTRDKDSGKTGQRFVLGRQVSGDTWQTGLITLRSGYMGAGGFAYDIEALAFFVDVRRSTGEIVRLWQSNGGANYSMSDAFGLPTSTKSIPYGNIQYADPAAAIFDTQRSCSSNEP
jgi:hypothetical protein